MHVFGNDSPFERHPEEVVMEPSFRNWVVDTAERTIGTAAASALGLFVADDKPVDLVSIDWEHGLGVVAVTSAITVLKCVAGRFKGDPDTGSLRG